MEGKLKSYNKFVYLYNTENGSREKKML